MLHLWYLGTFVKGVSRKESRAINQNISTRGSNGGQRKLTKPPLVRDGMRW